MRVLIRRVFEKGGVRIRLAKLPANPTLDLINQHAPVDHAEAVFFGEVLRFDDGIGHKVRGLGFATNSGRRLAK